MKFSNIKLEIIPGKKKIINREFIYEQDIWKLADIGIKPLPYLRSSSISFKKVQPEWLNILAKKFIRFQAATKAYYTIQQYLRSIVHFSNYIAQFDHAIKSQDINRELMLGFVEYVHNMKANNEGKNRLITHIKLMVTLASIEGWVAITKEKIMFRQDRLPVKRTRPRFIPESVLDQLDRFINSLSPEIRRFVMILQHTGRRSGEICAIPIDCIYKDAEGDYFLRYYEFKMKKEETIPINKEVAAVIDEQRQHAYDKFGVGLAKYLFPDKSGEAIQPYLIANALNKLASKYHIVGADGVLWHFQLHQFRHTVGTRMINAGVAAHIVQRYLKHSSPEMTMNYANIHDSTMKAEFTKFQGKLIDIKGRVVHEKEDVSIPEDLKWLKRNILAQALPNGYCGLPVQQGGCPHANACLSCSHFRTTPKFLDHHKRQLDETNRILDTAKMSGWTRQIENNERVKVNLQTIIDTLESP